MLRNELGEGVVVNRGEEEIGLDWEAVWCDAEAFEQALTAGDYERALELYRGDLLPGFHVADAPDFARFLDGERARYRREAAAAAWELAVRSAEAEDAVSAVRWARRAVAIEPLEEERLRTVITRLDELGDRTAAIGLFEDFARRLADGYEVEPAPETQELVASVRGRSVATRPATVPRDRPEAPADHPDSGAAARATRSPARRTVVVVAVVVALALSWPAYDLLRRVIGPPGAAAPRIAVLPLQNVGAAEDEWFADGMTDEITTRLRSPRNWTPTICSRGRCRRSTPQAARAEYASGRSSSEVRTRPTSGPIPSPYRFWPTRYSGYRPRSRIRWRARWT